MYPLRKQKKSVWESINEHEDPLLIRSILDTMDKAALISQDTRMPGVKAGMRINSSSISHYLQTSDLDVENAAQYLIENDIINSALIGTPARPIAVQYRIAVPHIRNLWGEHSLLHRYHESHKPIVLEFMELKGVPLYDKNEEEATLENATHAKKYFGDDKVVFTQVNSFSVKNPNHTSAIITYDTRMKMREQWEELQEIYEQFPIYRDLRTSNAQLRAEQAKELFFEQTA